MNRTLKAFGLALMVAFALSAVAAASASAQTVGKLTSTGPVTLIGEETGGDPTPEPVFYDNALTPGVAALGVLTCTESTYTGHKALTTAETHEGKTHQLLQPGETTVTITPHYKNCIANVPIIGKRPVTVTMNGCDYTFHAGETTGGEHTYGVTATIECPTGKVIEVEVFKAAPAPHTEANIICKIKVKGGQTVTGAHLTHTTVGDDVDLYGTFTGIHEEREGSLCGTGTSANAQLHADVTITGKNAEGGSTEVTITH